MPHIFDFTNYLSFLKAYLDRKEARRGDKGALAEALGVSPTFVSLLLRQEKQLSMEQASELAEFLHLSDHETDYLFLLVEYGRAGSFKLKEKLKRRIDQARVAAQKIANRMKPEKKLNEETRSIFYSSWMYSGIRNLSAVPGYQSAESIAKRVNLPLSTVEKVLEFLIEHELCIRNPKGITYGPRTTHVPSDSPHVLKHHQNWRLKGFSEMDKFNENNLFFTGPMSLSKEVADEVRAHLPDVVQKILEKVKPSPSEKVHCLNIDWFEF
jgi:uncharacterized protein (TIGR02147 family)